MRNLKKVLSLALALVMLLGMMVVGAGAATSFKDADEIENTEAVDVVSGIGVLQGDENGYFNPEGTLTRAEAAVVVAKLDLGAAFGNLETTNASTFSDVPAGYWGKPYIDYCFARGLIAGVGNNKYNPNGKVTGVEFALMVSRVLGYEDKAEQVGGADWEVDAAALARKAGLTVDVTLGSHAMTRDEMAQVAYNALKADMVEYKNGTIDITVGDTPVTIGGNPATPKANGKAHYDASVKQDNILQLCEEKFPQLTVRADVDAFNRPANVWTYKRDDIAEVPTTAMVEYTAGTKGTTIAKALKVKDSVKAEYYVDGKQTTSVKTVANLPASIGGNGVLTQAWYDEVTDIVKVTVINTYVGKVVSVQKATSSADRSVTVGVVDPNYQPGTSGQLAGKYTTENFASGEIVLYTAAWNGEKYAVETVDALGEPATGTLTRWNGSVAGQAQNNFTVAGEQYKSNVNSVVVDEAVSPLTGVWEFTLDKDEVNVYVDEYGYAIYVSGVEGTKNYAVVIGRGNTNPYGDETYGATLLLADGTQKSVTAKFTDKDNGSKWTDSNVVTDVKGDLVTYTVDDDNVYTLTSVDQWNGQTAGVTGNQSNGSASGSTPNSANSKFVNGKSLLELGSDKLYTTTNTLFFVCTGTGSNLTYTVYKGYNEMPGFDTVNGITGFAYTVNRNYSTQIDAIYVTAGQLADNTAANTYFVKTKNAGIERDSTGTYFTLPAIVDGEETEIKLSASVFYAFVDANSGSYPTTDNGAADNSNTQGFYAVNSVKVNKNGIITSMADAMSDFNAKAKDNSQVGTVASPGTVLGIGTNNTNVQFWSYNDKTKAFYVDKDYKTISAITVESIGTDTDDLAYAIATTGPIMLKEIVVIEDGSVVAPPPGPGPSGDSDATENPTEATDIDKYAGTMSVDFVHGAAGGATKVAADALEAAGYTIKSVAGKKITVEDEKGAAWEITYSDTEYFTVTVDNTTYYVKSDGKAKGAAAELELDLNANTYTPATKGTGYVKDIGSGDVYAAYASSSTKVKPKTDLFGNTITQNIVVKTGYVDVKVSTTSKGFAEFGKAYQIFAKTDTTAYGTANGTGVSYTVGGTDKGYLIYGGTIPQANVTGDIVLTQDMVKLTVKNGSTTVSESAIAYNAATNAPAKPTNAKGAGFEMNIDGAKTYVAYGASNGVTGQNGNDVTLTAGYVDVTWTVDGGLTGVAVDSGATDNTSYIAAADDQNLKVTVTKTGITGSETTNTATISGATADGAITVTPATGKAAITFKVDAGSATTTLAITIETFSCT